MLRALWYKVSLYKSVIPFCGPNIYIYTPACARRVRAGVLGHRHQHGVTSTHGAAITRKVKEGLTNARVLVYIESADSER